jgi:CRP-like cAMP-binding protein
VASSVHYDLGRFVARLTAHSALSAEEQQAILSLPFHQSVVSRKRDISQSAGSTSSAFVVASGLVSRFVQLSDGERQFTALYRTGDIVDLDYTVRPVSTGGLNACCDTTILRVSHRELRAVAARHPAVTEAFWRDCMVDAAVLMQWVVNSGRRDARTRIAHFLCEMAIRAGHNGSMQTEFDLPLSQEQIADAVALTSVHVNRSLKGLQQLALVQSKKVQIHNWRGLTEVAQFDGAYLVADAQAARRMIA